MKDQTYSHVIVVGIDGVGSFIKDADTPAFDRIFSDGAVTFGALASYPSGSAECWGSMLLGVGPEIHQLNFEKVNGNPYPSDSTFPSLFRRIREAMPGAELGSYCDWSPITRGMVENDVGVSAESAHDTELAPRICDYIRDKRPTFLFVQFDSIDAKGHHNGYGSPAHLKRASEVDSLLGDVYDAVVDAGIAEDTLFIAVSDHGGTNPGDGTGSHGGWSKPEKRTTLALRGKTVKKGAIAAANVRDSAAIVLYALGVDVPSFDENGWTSQVPAGIFDDDVPAYKDITHITDKTEWK